ncbi:MAG: hypothetical protein ABR954_04425 [Dehalococcoidales bacterium]
MAKADVVRLSIELMPGIVLVAAKIPKMDGAKVIKRIKTNHWFV